MDWNTICQFGLIEKPLRDFSSEQSKIKKELKFSRKQLDSLKFDIQNESIEKKEMKEYIESESDAVAEIVQTIKITNENTKTELNRFDTLNPKIEIIIKKIKKK
jgi:valyl-tRNA synthetase